MACIRLLRESAPQLACCAKSSHRIGLSKHHVLANARASHTNHPALGLCSGIFGIAGRGGIHQTRGGGVEGAVDGCRRHSNINIDSSKRLAQAQPLRASRRQLIARPSPSFRGRRSSWTAERLYFGHSLIAVYIMDDITSRLQLACLGEGRRGSARVTRREPWVTASRSTSLWSLRAIPDSQTEITRHAGDRRGVGLAPLA